MLQFLKATEYHIKTPHRISSSFISNLTSDLYGVLQGSGSTPAIWLYVGILLLKTYKKKFPTPSLSNLTGTDFIKKIADSFVNDTNLWDVLVRSTSNQILLYCLRQRAQY